ncbi:mannose-6-phosphate isomerase class I [Anaerobacterium chartisolvens]|uniref:Mannose-6-phosphate isomerase class I n=1 Tax=Anaerobacterium chartisolvens TaxID=1297424 RepID=A0A369AKT8_9FIRM|nr:class I mannose-6-phosphate isomerase [Anaerobacterium chartisolvens]RCX09970.1 mannose-6-phosphate isomerase class I [Anaerobacterium chartisolvens]
MSFMFNPYPYDDPNAVNHICFDPELKKTVSADSLASAKRLTARILEQLSRSPRCIVALDGYITAPILQFKGLLSLQLAQNGISFEEISTQQLFLDSDTLYENFLPYLPEDKSTDPVLLYGSRYEGGYESLMKADEIEKLSSELKSFSESGKGVLILYGYGSLIDTLRRYCTLKLFIDMTQKRTILNIRQGMFTNLGSTKPMPVNQILRRSYYIDFEVVAEFRGKLICNGQIDYYIAGDNPDKMKMLPLTTMKALFETMIGYPLRCRPVYLEGVWGGFYVKRLRNLPEEMKNCAWVFDLIPMEVSIAADIETMELEFPFYCFVQVIGPKLMGKKPAEKFNGYFPIRFNYDDTFHSSGNMSIQVHPNGDYIKGNNELGRQDESYYMVVTGQEAKTYCGFHEDADVEEFIEKARRAEIYGEGFDHDKYVYSEPSVAGQQFLIPAGTIHASGRNQVILEIGSLTIGSYTYKMYDYMRKDLDGNLRPIHTFHGDKVLRRDFKESWVKANLIQKPRVIREGTGFEETIVGQHDLIYFSLRNVRFFEKYEDETTDRFHVLVLVEGEKCLIRSLTNPDRCFEQNYLDMVIVPAGFGPYEVINKGVGKVTIHKTLLKEGFENE